MGRPAPDRAIGRSRGGLSTKIHHAVDGKAVLADNAHSSKAIRAELRRRRITSVIPDLADQQGHRKRRGSRGGRPVSYDRNLYKDCNVVERAFNLLKKWRGLATRSGKHAVNYRGAVVLAAILTWLRT
jgi:transposase